MTFPDLIARAVAEFPTTSDVFVRAGRSPIVRIDGALHDTGWEPLTHRDVSAMCELLLCDQTRQTLAHRRDVSVSFTVRDVGPVRAALFYENCGRLSAVARVLPRSCPTLDELGLPPAVAELTRTRNGLILVTGPVGCGKTTTQWAMLEQINRESFAHILSFQHPVSFVIEEKRSLVTLREIGTDAPSYAEAARAAFAGQDPDVVHIGELPDLETLSLALVLAETGHLVFSTMHTATAVETVERLVSVFPPHQQGNARRQLASVLRAVVAQQLVPRAEGKGRVPVIELMLVVPEIAKLIAEGRWDGIDAVIERHAGEGGMQTMMQALRDHVERGIITQKAAAITLGTGAAWEP